MSRRRQRSRNRSSRIGREVGRVEPGPRPHARRTTVYIIGLLLVVVGPVLTFRSRRGFGFHMDIDDALPWTGTLVLVGAAMLLWATWPMPRSWTGGPALGIILLVPVMFGVVSVLNRLDWPLYAASQLFGLVALALGIVLLALVTVRGLTKPREVM